MIVIIDYGMGNLHSVSSAVGRLGFAAEISSDPARIAAADGAILPGVGAFADAMDNISSAGLQEAITAHAASGKPLLGICLGMQLLFTESEEHGLHTGLGLLPGRVVRFREGLKIPHMGWNSLVFRQTQPLFSGVEQGFVYFVHSFHALADRADDVLATTNYGGEVSAIVGRGNIYGMQFHPEKSGAVGMRLLDNFLHSTRK